MRLIPLLRQTLLLYLLSPHYSPSTAPIYWHVECNASQPVWIAVGIASLPRFVWPTFEPSVLTLSFTKTGVDWPWSSWKDDTEYWLSLIRLSSYQLIGSSAQRDICLSSYLLNPPPPTVADFVVLFFAMRLLAAQPPPPLPVLGPRTTYSWSKTPR